MIKRIIKALTPEYKNKKYIPFEIYIDKWRSALYYEDTIYYSDEGSVKYYQSSTKLDQNIKALGTNISLESYDYKTLTIYFLRELHVHSEIYCFYDDVISYVAAPFKELLSTEFYLSPSRDSKSITDFHNQIDDKQKLFIANAINDLNQNAIDIERSELTLDPHINIFIPLDVWTVNYNTQCGGEYVVDENDLFYESFKTNPSILNNKDFLGAVMSDYPSYNILSDAFMRRLIEYGFKLRLIDNAIISSHDHDSQNRERLDEIFDVCKQLYSSIKCSVQTTLLFLPNDVKYIIHNYIPWWHNIVLSNDQVLILSVAKDFYDYRMHAESVISKLTSCMQDLNNQLLDRMLTSKYQT